MEQKILTAGKAYREIMEKSLAGAFDIDNQKYLKFEKKIEITGRTLLNISQLEKLKEFEKEPFIIHGNICFTHVRGEIPPHVKPEMDLELFAKYDLVLAGDLHSYENSQKNILYPGSPVTTSFHRHNVDTGIIDEFSGGNRRFI